MHNTVGKITAGGRKEKNCCCFFGKCIAGSGAGSLQCIDKRGRAEVRSANSTLTHKSRNINTRRSQREHRAAMECRQQRLDKSSCVWNVPASLVYTGFINRWQIIHAFLRFPEISPDGGEEKITSRLATSGRAGGETLCFHPGISWKSGYFRAPNQLLLFQCLIWASIFALYYFCCFSCKTSERGSSTSRWPNTEPQNICLHPQRGVQCSILPFYFLLDSKTVCKSKAPQEQLQQYC